MKHPFLLLLAVTAACGGSSAGGGKYPPRPEGCDVKIFHDAPTVPTDNLGPVRASCAEDVPAADCVRALEDEACKLGGDVIWGVPEKPQSEGGRSVWTARAAHTRGPATAGEGGSL